MAKSMFFAIVFLFLGPYSAFAQCTPSVSIVPGSTANAPALSCQAVMDTFWAVPVNGGLAPTYTWYVQNNNTPIITTDSFLICPIYVGSNMFRPAIYVDVFITVNDGCAVGSQSPYYNLAISPLPENVSITETTTQYNNDSALITYYISTYNVDSIYGIAPFDTNIAVIPRGTVQHPTIDTLSVIWQSGWGQVTSAFNCVNTADACNFYCFGDTLNAFTGLAGINQPLCIVSFDTLANKPIIVWEKVNKSATSAYYLFRTNGPFNASAQFNLVGVVNRDSLSAWEDTSAYPENGSYGYMIEAKDTNGIFSAPSASHWTIFLTALGAGNFSWTPYIISGDSLPLGTYGFYRDALGNGNWQLLTNISDTQTTASDADYASYPNARYMVMLSLANPCNPSRAVSTITSNILSHVNPTGIAGVATTGQIEVWPNPVHDKLTVSCPDINGLRHITVTNILGQTIYTSGAGGGSLQINTQGWQDGIYFITVFSANAKTTYKIVKS